MNANFVSSFLHLNLNGDSMEDDIKCFILEVIDSGKAKRGCLRSYRKKLNARVRINGCLRVISIYHVAIEMTFSLM